MMPDNNKGGEGGGFLQDVFIFGELLLNNGFVVFAREQRRLGIAPAVASVINHSFSPPPLPHSSFSPPSSCPSPSFVTPQFSYRG